MLRFQSALQVQNIPDEALENNFEVVCPTLYLNSNNMPKETGSWGSFDGFINNIKAGASNMFYGYTPIVEEIVFGVRNFGTNSRRVRTGWCNVPDDIQNYTDVTITFFCSFGMLIQYYLDTWKKLIFYDDGEYYNPMYYYKKNIEVYFYGPGAVGTSATSAAHYTLWGCFPYAQDTYKLLYSEDPKRIRLMARFKMDKIVLDEGMRTKAIIEELAGAPLEIGTRIIGTAVNGIADAIFGTEAQYSVKGTYS